MEENTLLDKDSMLSFLSREVLVILITKLCIKTNSLCGLVE